jgi:hypothetical protein
MLSWGVHLLRPSRIALSLLLAASACGSSGGGAGTPDAEPLPSTHGGGGSIIPPEPDGGGGGAAGRGGAGGRAGGGGGGSGGMSSADPCAAAGGPPPFASETQLGFLPATSTHSGSCGGPGGDVTFTITVDRMLDSLEIEKVEPSTPAEVVVYARRSCADTASEIACQGGPGGKVVIPSPAMGTYFVFADGPAGAGYQLRLRQRLPAGAACDPADTRLQCPVGLVCGLEGASALCRTSRCNDGADGDGDGKADYPLDPGCATRDDDDEADPSPLPACANGTDDDGDAASDYPTDPGCDAAGDTDESDLCLPGVPVEALPPSGVVMTDITNQPNAMSGSCGAPFFGTGERVYRVPVPEGAVRVTALLDQPSFLGAFVYLRKATCGDPMAEVACDAMGTVTLTPAPAATYFVIVDGAIFPGAFTLRVEVILGTGAACDPAIAMRHCDTGLTCTSGRCM